MTPFSDHQPKQSKENSAIPQAILPLIPKGSKRINESFTVHGSDNLLTYYHFFDPIYSHRADDLKMFTIIAAQLIVAGGCRASEIITTFEVSKSRIDRAVRLYREEGIDGFFLKKRKFRKRGSVLTPKVLNRAQELLSEGYDKTEVAETLKVAKDTLRKALRDGRLLMPKAPVASTKSERSKEDATAAKELGTACTWILERTEASVGIGEGAPTIMQHNLDITNGGVLCALPALVVTGLLEKSQIILNKLKGYYNKTSHILILIAFMALCRIRTAEQLRGEKPGELGKLLGLDRAPEVRCFRRKCDELSQNQAAKRWAIELSKKWMNSNYTLMGTLYIDGHMRVYSGSKTKLPRKYVSRERLCLRGVNDYWVNDATGQPFFVIEKPIDPGMIHVLKEDIVPRLLNDIPDQPSEQELENNPYLNRFILVFDREGYSPGFFKKMWKDHRIACMTYHKFPKEAWLEEEFIEVEVKMPRGETVKMKLAERGSWVGTADDALWVKEIRKLTESGHQTSMISTAFELTCVELAARMFTRWCQENFFRYAMEHYSIDILNEYLLIDFCDTEIVINPAWRDINKERQKAQSKLNHRLAKYSNLTLHPESEMNTKKYKKWEIKKSNLLEEIEMFEDEVERLKTRLKLTDKKIKWGNLPEEDKFQNFAPERKKLLDTVRMVSYRAETAMALLLVDQNVDTAAARRILQNLFKTEADLIPDMENKILNVRVHNSARPAVDRKLMGLFTQLNTAEFEYPGTSLKMIYELVHPVKTLRENEGVFDKL